MEQLCKCFFQDSRTYEAIKKGGTAVAVVPLIFLPCSVPAYSQITGYFRKSCLSHCRTVSRGQRGYDICYDVKNTGKYRKVPETTGKPESQESVSVALSHFFVNRRFQFSATQNASDIISFYPSLNKSAYF